MCLEKKLFGCRLEMEKQKIKNFSCTLSAQYNLKQTKQIIQHHVTASDSVPSVASLDKC